MTRLHGVARRENLNPEIAHRLVGAGCKIGPFPLRFVFSIRTVRRTSFARRLSQRFVTRAERLSDPPVCKNRSMHYRDDCHVDGCDTRFIGATKAEYVDHLL